MKYRASYLCVYGVCVGQKGGGVGKKGLEKKGCKLGKRGDMVELWVCAKDMHGCVWVHLTTGNVPTCTFDYGNTVPKYNSNNIPPKYNSNNIPPCAHTMWVLE